MSILLGIFCYCSSSVNLLHFLHKASFFIQIVEKYLYAFFLQIFSLFTWNPGLFFLLYLYSFSFSSKSFHPIIRRGKRHPLTKKQNKQMKSSLRLATDLRIVVNPWNLLNSSVDPILMSCNSHSGFCLPPLLSDLSLLFILFTLKLVFCWSLKNCLPAFM